MGRLEQVNEFIEYDINKNIIIEPKDRFNDLKERLFDIINSYKHEVIVKAGLGHGELLLEIARNIKSYIVVVEPSFKLITDFLNAYPNDPDIQNIKFLNGDFHEFPVDYYAADLLICTDYLDFFDSGKSINEFRRALKFDGILFLGTVVLNDNDIDGIYDEFIKLIFPLHNDYYLPEDLTTFLTLKEFGIIKNMLLNFESNLVNKIDYFQEIYRNVSKEKALEYIQSNKQKFTELLNMNENFNISEPYYFGVYTRKKPEKV